MFTPMVVLWFLPSLSSKKRQKLYKEITEAITSHPKLALLSGTVHIAAPCDAAKQQGDPVIVVDVSAPWTDNWVELKDRVSDKIGNILLDFFPVSRVSCKVRLDRSLEIGNFAGATHEFMIKNAGPKPKGFKIKNVRTGSVN